MPKGLVIIEKNFSPLRGHPVSRQSKGHLCSYTTQLDDFHLTIKTINPIFTINELRVRQ